MIEVLFIFIHLLYNSSIKRYIVIKILWGKTFFTYTINKQGDEKDEFETHFGDEQPDIKKRVEDIDERKWKISNKEDPILKLVIKYSSGGEENCEEENVPNIKSFKVKKKNFLKSTKIYK